MENKNGILFWVGEGGCYSCAYGCDLFCKVEDTKKLYEFMGDEYNVPENELICELDHFFQAILFRVAVSDDNLSDIELDFIHFHVLPLLK